MAAPGMDLAEQVEGLEIGWDGFCIYVYMSDKMYMIDDS